MTHDIVYKKQHVQITAHDIDAWRQMALIGAKLLRAAGRLEKDGVVHYAVDVIGSDQEVLDAMAVSERQMKAFEDRNPIVGSYTSMHDDVVFYLDTLVYDLIPNEV
jgi:hypothetical protein